MALEIKLNQKLSQSLVMTPQLQQAIKLLQLGRTEYLEVLEKELQENPVLEDLRETLGVDMGSSGQSGIGDSSASEGERAGEFSVSSQQNLVTEVHNDNTLDRARLHERNEWMAEAGADYQRTYTRRLDDEDDRPSLEGTVSNPEGLSSHLFWQLRISDIPVEDHNIGAQIIGNLDRNGYLGSSIEEIAEMACCSVENAERVLRSVQSMDPPGVAARNLRECLLIQLEQQGLISTLAYRIVEEHLSKLEIRRYDLIAKEECITVEEVYDAVKEIQKLEPRPGRPFIDESPIYITPDIYVRKVGEHYVIQLNDAGMPRLRMSPHYRELLLNGVDTHDKQYLQECVKSASWLIKSIYQRQRTIYRVTQSIMSFQREFLEKGVAHLRPLVLKEVAADVGMHESTVSRVTTNKYVHTPQGVFELKFFFTSGLRTGQGEVSSESVKQRINEMISGEDPRKPLSDQTIAETLKKDGVDIARRTVAKYREMLNILSSSRRKKMF